MSRRETNELPDRLVVLGASAGGLKPLRDYFHALGEISQTAFVIIQHLSPDYKSMMGELLERSTGMKIRVVDQDMVIKPGEIHLIPPAFNMLLGSGGHFILKEKTPGIVSLPIDIFAMSAAEVFGSRIMLVILSGTGSDGTRGIEAVNAAGGVTLCQAPETAQFDGMPNSAIATGLIDEVGAPEWLAKVTADCLKRGPGEKPFLETHWNQTGPEASASAMQELFRILMPRFGIDFSKYKQTTILRRIERRLVLKGMVSLDDYVRTLRKDREEADALCREFLIGVTNFFRDPEAFDALKAALLQVIEGKGDGEALRLWVAGCSTGQEVYSVAIVVQECLKQTGRALQVKIFGTDAEQFYLDVAAAGIYPEALCNDIPKHRLEANFIRSGASYKVRQSIRQDIVFARHNMIADAPFTRLDAIMCRNVLIYFNTDLQEHVLRRFQYALGPGGLLFLGSSESVGALQRDFETLSSSHRVYRVLRPGTVTVDALRVGPHIASKASRANGMSTAYRAVSGQVERGRQIIIDTVAPPSVLLNQENEVLHVYGDVSPFVRVPKGDMSYDIRRLVSPQVSAAIASLVRLANKTGRPVRSGRLLGVSKDPLVPFHLHLTPLEDEPNGSSFCLLSFVTDGSQSLGTSRAEAPDDGPDDLTQARFKAIQQELSDTRESLRNTIEELETSNEELQATNEELLASNEELQSTNEELQSVNEELYTVNSEYQEKIKILDQLNTDLDAMAEATGIPTIFLDDELHITRFTPSVRGIFELRDTDIGRPLSDFSNKLGYENLIGDAETALHNNKLRELVWESGVDKLIIRHVPYIDAITKKTALVLMFLDVSSLERLDFLQTVIDSLPEHIVVLDGEGHIRLVNEAWTGFALENGGDLQSIGVGAHYLSACKVKPKSSDPCSDDDTAGTVENNLCRMLAGEIDVFSIEYPCHSTTEDRWFLMHAKRLRGEKAGLVISHVNTTAWHERQTSVPAGQMDKEQSPQS